MWRLDASKGRTGATGVEWSEDLEWARRLDACWNLSTARGVAARLVSHYNDPGMVKVRRRPAAVSQGKGERITYSES